MMGFILPALILEPSGRVLDVMGVPVLHFSGVPVGTGEKDFRGSLAIADRGAVRLQRGPARLLEGHRVVELNEPGRFKVRYVRPRWGASAESGRVWCVSGASRQRY